MTFFEAFLIVVDDILSLYSPASPYGYRGAARESRRRGCRGVPSCFRGTAWQGVTEFKFKKIEVVF
jgi:hypothetical protein